MHCDNNNNGNGGNGVIVRQIVDGAVIRKGYSPYIADNGHWMMYDDATGEFFDAGIPAQGPQGNPGPQGIPGPQGDPGDGDMNKSVFDPTGAVEAEGGIPAYVENHGGGTTGVTSFNGRTGAVTPQSGDYNASQVGADAAGTASSAVSTHNADSSAHSSLFAEKASASHIHGNVSSDGKIGSAALDNTLVHLVNGALKTLAGTAVSAGANIATGSYVGTGTFGEDHPNTLTFPFEPKMVIVYAAGTISWAYGTLWPWISGMTSGISGFGINTGTPTEFSKTTVTLSWRGNTVSWYAFDDEYASYQLNDSGETYNYIAIG